MREHLPNILYALHLTYENSKLDVLTAGFLKPLAMLLAKTASKLNLVSYVDHYLRDFGELAHIQIPITATQQATVPSEPPSIYTYAYAQQVYIYI